MRALVAMSGGVDSSVAAAIVVEKGMETIGVTLQLLSRGQTGYGCCGSPADIEDAKNVCGSLGIPHYAVDMAELFEDRVIKPFVHSYLNAQTPNPCAECNKHVKFGQLLSLAEAWRADVLVTGHYARSKGGRLYRAKDALKDQSYFLYSLGREQIGRSMFPVGEMAKGEVRDKARALGLKTAEKEESQELCFIPARDYRSFLKSRPESRENFSAFEPGPIHNISGEVMGRHKGLAYYTVGQRAGMTGFSAARYVVRLEPESNVLVVGGQQDVFSSSCLVSGVVWTQGDPPPALSFSADVRIRHRHTPVSARLERREDGLVEVFFSEPQRAATCGQSAVFYYGEEVLGGGTISRA